MKANHNNRLRINQLSKLLPMSKDTINESKSQLLLHQIFSWNAVAYEQRYNKWKQITTTRTALASVTMLLPMSKDTINESKSQQQIEMGNDIAAVAYEQRYNKWKQITTICFLILHLDKLLPMSKDTINESKSQQISSARHLSQAVAYEQRYNKWKQITTGKCPVNRFPRLLPMSKDTINESKSQHRFSNSYHSSRCCLWAKIQ